MGGGEDCGRCVDLRFTDRRHQPGNWGGAHPDLVGNALIVQVASIGCGVIGSHSFDLHMPGAGQGLFSYGCERQFLGVGKDAFDCGRWCGGCGTREECTRLPAGLRPGGEWRFGWLLWLKEGWRSNRPWARHRRTPCPEVVLRAGGTEEPQ